MAELRLVEQVMSLYRPNSQVCRLNRRGSLDGPHPYLVEVLRRAAGISQASAGAFDITVQPLWKAYAASAKSGELPDDAELARITKFVDWRQVVVSRQRIEFARPSMEITLNGIAQGFAADRAMAALRRHGIQRALVDTGEIGAIGCNRSDSAWTAGIQHPRHPDAYISLIELDGRCLATSGDYATVFGDVTHNHLLDPRSGRSPREFSSVSIVAPTAMDADALSTAVFVLGTDKGLELIQSIPGVDGHFVLKDGRTIATKGFPVKAA
jgi:thiamine biosynthesis lipoprotein